MLSVKVIGRQITLTGDDGSLYEFDIIVAYPGQAIRPGWFTAATIRRKGRIDLIFQLPNVVPETIKSTYFGDTVRILELREHTRNDWFVMMVNTIIESLG